MTDSLGAPPDRLAVKDEVTLAVVLQLPVADDLEGFGKDLVFAVVFALDLDRDDPVFEVGHGAALGDDGCL